MTNVIPFRTKITTSQEVNTRSNSTSTIKMTGCHFEDNGIGMLLGDGVEVDMDDTTFLNNGAGIVAGSIDEQMLKVLSDALPVERFKFAADLERISNISDKNDRLTQISKSSIAEKLSTFANITTVTTWINDAIEGASGINFEQLLNTIMGG